MIRATVALAPVLVVLGGLAALALGADSFVDPHRRSLVGRLVCALDRRHLWVWVTLDDLDPREPLHVVRCRRCGARV